MKIAKIALLLSIILVFALTFSSCANQGDIDDLNQKVDSLKPGTDNVYANALDFYPLPDGTYGVKAGNTLYMDKVVIPAEYNGKPVTQILPNAFENATNLTEIVIPNSVTSIGWSAFSGCSSFTSVVIPDSVTSIGSCAFYDCSSLTSITIPDSVTSIGYKAFDGCDNLTNVYITNLTSWCSIGFDDSAANPLAFASNLYFNNELVTKLVIPDSVTSIGDYAFYNCDSLTNVVIPDSVTEIGYGAFSDCSSLTNVVIPDSVTSIGIYAFRYCSSLTSVEFKDPNGWYRLQASEKRYSISSSYLANTSTAAQYLRNTYSGYPWEK